MQTRVSTKGQIVLPGELRRQLGIRAGDPLDVEIDGTRIVLTTRKTARHAAEIIEDPITGLPALSHGSDAPVLTSQEVYDMLSQFP